MMFGKLNADLIRRQKLIRYAESQEQTPDKISFIASFLKLETDQQKYNKFRGDLEDSEFEKIIETIKYKKIDKPGKILESFQDYHSIPPILILDGQVTVQINQKNTNEDSFNFMEDSQKDVVKPCLSLKKNFIFNFTDEFIHENDLTFQECENAESFSVQTTSQKTELFYFDREIWNDLLKDKNAGENQEKLKILKKVLPYIKKTENRKAIQIMHYFKQQQYPPGAILTTLTSGSHNLFVVKQGRVLLYTLSNKINPQYNKKYIILQIIEKNTIFNEVHCLFEQEQIYGAMILDSDTQVLQLDKTNFKYVTDADCLENLRASFQARQRLQKKTIAHLKSLTPSQLLSQQQSLLVQKNLLPSKIDSHFENSLDPKSEKIVTFFYKGQERQKNLKTFDEIQKKQKLDLSKQNGVLMTPRIISKDGKFKGLDSQQQQSLLSLRMMGLSSRQNKDQNSPQTLETLEQEKIRIQNKALANKNSDLLERKQVKKQQFDSDSSKDDLDLEIEEKQHKNTLVSTKNDPESQLKVHSLKKRLSITKEQALEKIGILKKPKEIIPKGEFSSSDEEDNNGVNQNQKQNQNFTEEKPPLIIFRKNNTNNNKNGNSNNSNSINSNSGFNGITVKSNMNKNFLDIEKDCEDSEVQLKPKINPNDKFAAQRKKLLKFGI